MASLQYYDFIANSWKQLSEEDRSRMAELWTGLEQSVAAIYQKYLENSFNASLEKQFTYSTERWLPYSFSESNRIFKAAIYKSKEDLSGGVNLSTKHLLKFSWDGGIPVEVSLRGFNPVSTRIDEIVDKINLYAGFKFVKKDVTESLLEFTSPSISVDSKITFHQASIPLEDASEFILGILPQNLPLSVPDYPYYYSLPYPRLVSIPMLQDAIRDETKRTVLAEGVDYIISGEEAWFKTIPPSVMWAKRSLFDEEWPWNDFGYLLDIYQENSDRYVEIVKGLWFAFWTGPKPKNIKRSLYLLFGLPTAPFDGFVSYVDSSRIDVTSIEGEVRSFSIPLELQSIVVKGQRVETFDPLVSGIDIFDKVNYPGFLEEEVGRYGIQRFLLDEATRGIGPDTDETRAMRMLEEYTFLPQINVNAFVRQDINLSNIRFFLEAIKPVVKTYLFQVIVGTFRDGIIPKDSQSWELDIDVSPNVDMNETTRQPQSVLLDHETVINSGLCVDSEGVQIQEALEIEVRTFGTLLDLFEV